MMVIESLLTSIISSYYEHGGIGIAQSRVSWVAVCDKASDATPRVWKESSMRLP